MHLRGQASVRKVSNCNKKVMRRPQQLYLLLRWRLPWLSRLPLVARGEWLVRDSQVPVLVALDVLVSSNYSKLDDDGLGTSVLGGMLR